MYMAKLASRNGGEDPSVTYGDLAAVVQRKESMEFLHDILPKKVLFQNQYLKFKLKPTYFYCGKRHMQYQLYLIIFISD